MIDGSENPCDEKGLISCSYILQSDAPNQDIVDLEDAYTVFDYSDGKSKRVGFGN